MHSDRVSAALAATLALSLTASAASAQALIRPKDVTIEAHVVVTKPVPASPERIAALKLPPGFHIAKWTDGLTEPRVMLLGIAGGAALLTRTSGPLPAQGHTAVTPAPSWSDLVVVDGQVDVTRLQMLVFTLVSAAFVALKVISSYEIPEIPTNFQLLMGVSNGIYVAGRSLPSGTETGVPSQRNAAVAAHNVSAGGMIASSLFRADADAGATSSRTAVGHRR